MILTDEEIERLGGAAFDDHAYKGTRVMNAELARAIEAAVLDKMREQEPVAWRTKRGTVWASLQDDTDEPLYLHPSADAQDAARYRAIEQEWRDKCQRYIDMQGEKE